MTTTQRPMTETQATDEALLLIRKLRRLHPAAFADLRGRLPEAAYEALTAAERRADVHRDSVGDPAALVWPLDEEEDETEE
jgi:hypothetical protein